MRRIDQHVGRLATLIFPLSSAVVFFGLILPNAARGDDITVTPPTQDIWTTSIYSFAPGGGGPGGGLADENLKVGGWGDLYYSLLEFNLAGLPQSSPNVELELSPIPSGGNPTGITVNQITQYWNWQTQGTGADRLRLWWADQPSTVPYITSPLPAPTVGQPYYINITSLYNGWQNGTIPNYGIELQPTASSNNNFDFFASSRYPTATMQPQLVIEVPSAPPPTPQQLAALSNAVYKIGVNAASNSITPQTLSVPASGPGTTSFSLVGDNINDPYKGLFAATFASSDASQSQIVIDFRGTDLDPSATTIELKNLVADASFTTGTPSANLVASVQEAVQYVEQIQKQFPKSNITLTGHSLGGAIAQIIGAETGYTTDAFNAPGAGALYNSLLDNPATGLLALPKSTLQGTDTNYRIYGDVLSQFGTAMGAQITLAGSNYAPSANNDPQALVDKIAYVINNTATLDSAHNMSNFLQSNFVPVSDAGEPNLTGIYLPVIEAAVKSILINILDAYSQNPFDSGVSDSTLEQYSFKSVLSAADALGIALDPYSGIKFALQEEPGSPFLTSIDLPTMVGLASYNFRYETGDVWSSFELLTPGTMEGLGPSVDGVEFDPLTLSGQPFAMPDGFLFELSFSGPGDFSSILTEEIASVPEVSTWTMMLLGIAGLGIASYWRDRPKIFADPV